MSDETTAVDGANTAAPVEATEQVATQETSAATAEAEQGQEQRERDEQGRFKAKKDAQDRINELTRARRQAERERDFYREQVQQRQPVEPAATDKLPAFEDFNDLNAWGKAIAERAAHEARQVAVQEFSQRQQQAQASQVLQSYEAKEAKYASENPGYQDALGALQSTVRFSPELIDVIGTSDHGPAIVHYLGEHLDTADRLQRLPPHLAAAEVARLEARVSAPKQKPVSKAPSPVPTVQGGGTAQKNPEQMSTTEWLAWRNAQLKAK